MRSDGQTPPKKGMTRVSFLCDIHLPSHGALCHAESRQHGLCRAETGVVGQFSVELRGGKLQKPRGSLFVINGSKDCSVQVTFAEGFFGLTFDDLMTFVATCKSCNAGLQHAVLLDLGLRWATIWRKMMPTLQTTFRHLVAMFVFFDIFSKTEFNSYVVCTAIWY